MSGKRVLRLGLYPTKAGMVEVTGINWPYAYGTDAAGQEVAWSARNGCIYCPGTTDHDITGELITVPLKPTLSLPTQMLMTLQKVKA